MSDDGKVTDLGHWRRRSRGLLADVDPGEAVLVTDKRTGRLDAVLWVRQLEPAEEAAVIEAVLDGRFPDGY